MKNRLSKKIVCLAAAAVILVGSLSIGDALAYFTTYVASEGERTLDLKFADTVVHETKENGKKVLVIENQGDGDCYVRVKVIVAETYKNIISVVEQEESNNWSDTADAQGYYYYTPVVTKADGVAPKTTPLHVNINVGSIENSEDFNVIVIQENTPVLYDDNGNAYADWDGSDFEITKKTGTQ